VGTLPKRGKQRLPKAPAYALVGQIYINTTNNREWIFDGRQWVPHDNTVEEYYLKLAAGTTRLTPDEVLVTGACTTSDATGAHAKHDAFNTANNCKICHVFGGILCFNINGPAVSPGQPLPSFDATSKTCSNVACHGVRAGTYSYYMPGNDMDENGDPIPELRTVPYGGTMVSTPSWYATGVVCTACHGNPPSYGGNYYLWHSGGHAAGQNLGGGPGPNDCELCHNDPTKPYPNYVPIAFSTNGHGYQINPAAASQHANGTATVYAKFKTICFLCH
jgi:hypothetical protein